jgi:hydrogenase expression/formation protein HypE
MTQDRILLEHGGGGLLSHELVAGRFLPLFRNPWLEQLEDGAVAEIEGSRLCLTTDSYVVQPPFFPGGDIGSLAVHGTVNDLAVCGATPLFLSAAFILEEGFPLADLDRIVASMAEAAREAGVRIVTGDTKVVHRGAADGIFVNTSGIGVVRYPGPLGVRCIEPGDAVILSGFLGDHGAAVLGARQDLGFRTSILSDSAPLNGLVAAALAASPRVHCMRDATRGGLGSILAEIAAQAGLEITIDEGSIPVREEVRGVCEILGLDPLFLANEGKLALFCPGEEAGRVLEVMKRHPLGRDAAIVGAAGKAGKGRLVLRTAAGGSRVVDLPTGELVPRIC